MLTVVAGYNLGQTDCNGCCHGACNAAIGRLFVFPHPLDRGKRGMPSTGSGLSSLRFDCAVTFICSSRVPMGINRFSNDPTALL